MADTVAFDPQERQYIKLRHDASTTFLIGTGSTVMMYLTAMILLRVLSPDAKRFPLFLVAVTLVISSVFWFMGKKDDRKTVVSILINNIGLGVGLTLLINLIGIRVEPLDFAIGALPGIAMLGIYCLVFGIFEDDKKFWVNIIGVAAFIAAIAVSVKIALDYNRPVCLAIILSIVLSLAWVIALAWHSSDSSRSIHRTLALVSFIIYIVLIAVVLAILFLKMNDDSDSRSSGGSSKSRSSGSGSSRSESFRSRRSYSHGYARHFGFTDYLLYSAMCPDPLSRTNYSMEQMERDRRRTSFFQIILVGLVVAVFVAVVLALVL